MRLLLTRAIEDAGRTREKLEAAGHRVTISPVIEVVATGARMPAGVVDAMLATSGQAFAVDLGLSPEMRRLVPLLLVGRRTEEVARQHGFGGAALVAPNASMLAVEIGKLATVPRRIVYVAGRNRKPDIETALEVTGRPVEAIEVYEARPASALDPVVAAALGAHRIDAVLHYSRRSAALFLTLARKAGLDPGPVLHLCLSKDVAAPLREAGFARIGVSEAPNEAALLARLDQA